MELIFSISSCTTEIKPVNSDTFQMSPTHNRCRAHETGRHLQSTHLQLTFRMEEEKWLQDGRPGENGNVSHVNFTGRKTASF